MSIFDLAMIT